MSKVHRREHLQSSCKKQGAGRWVSQGWGPELSDWQWLLPHSIPGQGRGSGQNPELGAKTCKSRLSFPAPWEVAWRLRAESSVRAAVAHEPAQNLSWFEPANSCLNRPLPFSLWIQTRTPGLGLINITFFLALPLLKRVVTRALNQGGQKSL